MAKKKANKKTVSRRPKPSRKTTKTRPKEKQDVTALITAGVDVGQLVGRDRDDLTKWFNLYLAVEENPQSHTHRAKVGDIQWFLRFFHEASGGYHCDDWTRGRTKNFVSWITKQVSDKTGRRLAPSTAKRIFDTAKHAAGWIHRQRPFLAGHPCEEISGIALAEPDWQGLTDLQVRRLRAAAEQLVHLQTRSNQLPLRNQAILSVLLDTGLRVFELADLQLDQYRRRALWNIQRKGDKVTGKIPLSSESCQALNTYISQERAEGGGPLFQSKNGKPLAQQNVDTLLQAIASQANARLSKDEHISLSPHVLRHTALRKWTQKKGVQFAQKIAGHASDRYIWRYVTPSDAEVQVVADELWS